LINCCICFNFFLFFIGAFCNSAEAALNCGSSVINSYKVSSIRAVVKDTLASFANFSTLATTEVGVTLEVFSSSLKAFWKIVF